MKINLPLITMIEGLKLGGACALEQYKTLLFGIACGLPNTDILIRLTASKKSLTFESSDGFRRVAHTIEARDPIEVEQEGAWCFEIGELYPKLSHLEASARVAGSAHRFEMTYIPPAPEDAFPQFGNTCELTSYLSPLIHSGGSQQRPTSFGKLMWAASTEDPWSVKSGLPAFPAYLLTSAGDTESTTDLPTKPPTAHVADEFLWEVKTKAIQAALKMVGSAIALAKHGQSVDILIRHGHGFLLCATTSSAVLREITPSEIAQQGKLEADLTFRRGEGLGLLGKILATAKAYQSPNANTVKLFLTQDKEHVRFDVGTTSLFVALRGKEKTILPALACDFSWLPVASLHE